MRRLGHEVRARLPSGRAGRTNAEAATRLCITRVGPGSARHANL